MESQMDDSLDEIIANMEIPKDPGPTAPKIMKFDKPTDDEKNVKNFPSHSSSSSHQSSSSSSSLAAATTIRIASKNTIQVNPNQKGNPVLKAITNCPWEFNNDIIADYEVGANGKFYTSFPYR